jgi:hypothetical protein
MTILEFAEFSAYFLFLFFSLKKKKIAGNFRDSEHANTSLIVGAFFNNRWL